MKNILTYSVSIVFSLLFLFACNKDDADFDIPEDENPIGQDTTHYDTIEHDKIITGDYYVATWGNDTNPGTFERPWGTWQKAFETAEAGDTVYFRGGTWYPTECAYSNNVIQHSARDEYNLKNNPRPIGHDGTAEYPICFFNYPGETPILDCSKITAASSTNGYITGIQVMWSNYLHFKGLTIQNIFDRNEFVHCNGISLAGGSNFTLENMVLRDIDGEGLYIGISGGYSKYGSGIETDTTKIINCDIYNCWNHVDLGSGIGGWADGLKANNGSAGEFDGYLLLDGCRVWNCSDDAFDPGGGGLIEIRNCWLFDMGHLNGDGVGIKTGGTTLENITFVNRKIYNNIIALGKTGISMVEYPEYYRLNARVYNNTIFRTKTGITISYNQYHPESKSQFYNNIIFEPQAKDMAKRPAIIDAVQYYKESNNTWDYGLYGSLPCWLPTDSVTVTQEDFVSIDWTEMKKPRNPDGTLPEISFINLAHGSDLIDAGTRVGLPFLGKAPDIGAFESE